MTRRTLELAALTLAVALPGLARAQEPGRPEAEKPAAKAESEREQPKPDAASDRRGPHGVPLRVQLVITRMQGDKKLASFPYALVVATGGPRTRMRLGIDTPVPVTTLGPPEGERQKTSFQYKTVGTNIDCAAASRGEGRYLLSLGVESSSALPGAPGSVEGAAPLFRRFDTNLELWLRDGETVQAIASTDPVTGEVVKIDVALNVLR
jgi:hypothetical protein